MAWNSNYDIMKGIEPSGYGAQARPWYRPNQAGMVPAAPIQDPQAELDRRRAMANVQLARQNAGSGATQVMPAGRAVERKVGLGQAASLASPSQSSAEFLKGGDITAGMASPGESPTANTMRPEPAAPVYGAQTSYGPAGQQAQRTNLWGVPRPQLDLGDLGARFSW